MSRETGRGIWIDGKHSEEELAKLQKLLREAIRRAGNGTLPWKYKDEKITFEAFSKGGILMVFHGWNFPPKEFWVEEDRGTEECFKCFPDGFDKPIGREVWCHKLGYNFPKCPYGVKTPNSQMPTAW